MSSPASSPAAASSQAVHERLFSLPGFLGLVAVLGLMAIACQYEGFHSLMVYDEAYFIKSKEPIFAQHDVIRLIGIVPVRPLFLFSFYVNYLFTGLDPFYLRVTNAIIVCGSGLALTVLSVLIFGMGRLRAPGSERARYGVGVLIGLLFVVHPLQSFVVLYSWQREAIMACFFYLWGLVAYLATRTGCVHSTMAGYGTAAVLFLLGMLSKENVATFPIALVIAELTLFGQSLKQTCSRAATIALFAVPSLAVYLVVTQLLHRNDSELVNGVLARLADHYSQSGLSVMEVVLTQCRVCVSYVAMTVFPVVQDVEFMRAETLSRSLLNPPITLVAVVAVLGWLSVGIALVRRLPIVAFGMLCAVVALLPESLLIPQYLFFGYRAILPMAFIMLAGGYAVLALMERLARHVPAQAIRNALLVSALLAVFGLAAVTAGHARKWSHVSFWTTLLERLPPYSAQVETVPFLDIVVNCMSTLSYAERYTQVIDIFERVLDPHAQGEALGGDGRDMGSAIERFAERFGQHAMRAGGAMITLGVALQATGRTQDAILAYRKAVQIEPHHTDVYLTLGALLEDSGDVDAAITKYREAIKTDPGSALARNCLGNALKKTDKLPEAMDQYYAAIQLAPDVEMGYLNLGLGYQELGYYKEAVGAFRSALTVAPRSAEAHHRLGRAMAETGNLAEAVTHYRAALAEAPCLAAAHSDLGLAFEDDRKLPEAIDAYRRAVTCEPHAGIHFTLLGRALARAGRTGEAITALTGAIELAPDSALAYVHLGKLYAKTANPGAAAALLRRAAELEPGLAEAHAELGNVLTKTGKASEAVQHVIRALDLRPDDAAPHIAMGRALESMGDHSLAEGHFRTAVRLRPDSVEANFRLGNHLLKAGKAPEAVNAYADVLRLKPDSAEAHANMALAMLHAGRIPEAIVILGKALSLNDRNARVLYALGRAFAVMKNDKEAQLYLEQAKELGPDIAGLDERPQGPNVEPRSKDLAIPQESGNASPGAGQDLGP
ncbi:MAG: tetratricopeptide repeat protein [Thermodesulfobacteriota bacterium]